MSCSRGADLPAIGPAPGRGGRTEVGAGGETGLSEL